MKTEGVHIENTIKEFVSRDQILFIEKFNPRDEKNYDINNLYNEIKEFGILIPVLVSKSDLKTEDGREKYYMFDGYRRLTTQDLVCEKENITRDIPVRIFEKKTMDELLVLSLVLGSTGKALKTSEKARAILRLINDYFYDVNKICEIMKITPSNVSHLKKFEDLPDNLKEKIDNEIISFNEAITLYEKVGENPEVLEKIIKEAEESTTKTSGKITKKNIQETVKNSKDADIKAFEEVINSDKSKIQLDIEKAIQNSKKPEEVINPDHDQLLNEIKNEQNNHPKSENKPDEKPKATNQTSVTSKENKKLCNLHKWLVDASTKSDINYDKTLINLLEKIVKYEKGDLSIEEVVDYFELKNA